MPPSHTAFTRRGFLQTAAMLGSPGLLAAQATERRRSPNFLILFVDDLGWADVGYQGTRFDTPRIDRLAREGVRFTRTYIPCPTCSPSRAALLTGQHPARLRMVRHIPAGPQFGFDRFGRSSHEFHQLPSDPAQFPSRNWLPLETVTIAEALKPGGYRSAFVGKWHLGSEPYHPIYQGFDVQFGVSNFGHPGGYYPPYWPQGDPYAESANGKYLTDRIADDAVEYLERQNGTDPFLLSVFFYNVHAPHQGRRDLVSKYETRGLKGREAHYGAMVEATDEAIGRILDALAEKNLDRDTVVLFLGDQGGYFSNPPLRGGKTGGMALFEGGARVPMAIRWRGVTQAGRQCDAPVMSTDLFPTLVEIAGQDPADHKPLDGHSLAAFLRGGRLPDREPIVLYRHYEDLYAAVLEGEWKLIASWNGDHQLYHLAADPAESNDLAAKYPAKLESLLATLRRWKRHVGLED